MSVDTIGCSSSVCYGQLLEQVSHEPSIIGFERPVPMIRIACMDNVCFCRHLFDILVGDIFMAGKIQMTDEERHGNVSDLRHIDWRGGTIVRGPILLKFIEFL